MAFGFRRQRPDGYLVNDGDPMNLIIPYMMRSRIESQIFYKYHIPYEAIGDYIKSKRRQGIKITFFNVLVAAIQRTMSERPKMNRFVAGRRLYQRNSFEILYVVKDSLTDEGNESVARLKFDDHDDLFTIAEKMDTTNKLLRSGKENLDDKAILWLLKMPRCIISTVFAIYRCLDYYGLAPKAAIQQFPFYSSVFISHLGTIGGDAVFHHLYEMGTCSIFLTVGRLKKYPFYENGELDWRKSLELAFTIDERICDGYYLVKSLKHLNKYLLNPELLETPLKNKDEKFDEDAKARFLSILPITKSQALRRLRGYLTKHKIRRNNEEREDK